jgi:hypothetical protein
MRERAKVEPPIRHSSFLLFSVFSVPSVLKIFDFLPLDSQMCRETSGRALSSGNA